MSLGGGLNFLKYTRKFGFVSIDAHGLKIQGEGQGGFSQILGGRVYRGCENFGGRPPEGTTFWCFIAFLLISFAKILEGGYTFIPPSPPLTPPLCASMQRVRSFYQLILVSITLTDY
jgi:hypothetical protein